MVENSSIIIGFVNEDEKLVDFGRVLTDFVFRATIFDVIVAEALRGRGLSRRQHPRHQRVSTLRLCCKSDMTPFFEK